MGKTNLTGTKGLQNFRFEDPVSLTNCVVQASVQIGMHTYANPGTFIRSNVHIGRYTSIGRNCTIGTGSHNVDSLSTSAFFAKRVTPVLKLADNINRIRVLCGNDVWIGDNAIIFSGVKIGDGAVIGGGAIVTKDVEPYAIVVGSPAKILRLRFSYEQIITLQNIKWWEFSESALMQVDINDIDRAISDLLKLDDSLRTYRSHNFKTIKAENANNP